MMIINFSHALTDNQVNSMQQELARPTIDVIDIETAVDRNQPLHKQATQLVDRVGWDSKAWQTRAFFVNPPSLSSLALLVIAEIHGRRGEFPRILVLRRSPQLEMGFEVAEILDLQNVRDLARKLR